MLKKQMFKNLAMASAVSLMPLFGCSTDGMQIYDEYSEGNQTETTSQSEANDSLRSYQAVGPATFTADPSRLLAAQCAQCHGTDGRSRNGIESLAHEGSGEVIEEMLEMQNSAYTNDIMHQQARGYSQSEVRLLATWFDTQRSGTSGSSSDGSEDSSNDDDHENVENDVYEENHSDDSYGTSDDDDVDDRWDDNYGEDHSDDDYGVSADDDHDDSYEDDRWDDDDHDDDDEDDHDD
ncbi:MAG: c-type cytochrome [bacterium]